MTSDGEIRRKIVERIRRGGTVLVASHVGPDGDSVGSQLATYDLCRNLGAEPMIVNQDVVSPRYQFLRKRELIKTYDREFAYPDFDLAILLEATEPRRIGEVRELVKPECEIINIDHHPGNLRYGSINLIDEAAAAAGVLIYHLFLEAAIAPSVENANELLTAIVTDTGRYCFSNTNAEAMEISARLIDIGANTRVLCDALYSQYSEDQVRLLGELISRMELYHEGRTCFLVCDRSLCSKYAEDAAEMEGLVNYSLFTGGVQVGVLLREIEEEVTKVSLRSNDTFDVGELARRYQGGGHANAAGCYLRRPLAEAKAELLRQIEGGIAG